MAGPTLLLLARQGSPCPNWRCCHILGVSGTFDYIILQALRPDRNEMNDTEPDNSSSSVCPVWCWETEVGRSAKSVASVTERVQVIILPNFIKQMPILQAWKYGHVKHLKLPFDSIFPSPLHKWFLDCSFYEP